MLEFQKRYFLELIGIDCSLIKWVLKAIAKDHIHRQLERLLIENHEAIATDGHRIHVAKLSKNYPPGLYNPLKVNQNKIYLVQELTEAEFPDWHSVFLSFSKDKFLILNNIPSINYALLLRNIHHITINFRYFFDLGDDEFTVYLANDEKAGLLFKSRDSLKRAIIMPMRM